MLTAFGALAATTMVLSYALEGRHRYWIAAFAAGCTATAFYGLLTGAWIFAVLESVWAVIAVHRFRRHKDLRSLRVETYHRTYGSGPSRNEPQTDAVRDLRTLRDTFDL